MDEPLKIFGFTIEERNSRRDGLLKQLEIEHSSRMDNLKLERERRREEIKRLNVDIENSKEKLTEQAKARNKEKEFLIKEREEYLQHRKIKRTSTKERP